MKVPTIERAAAVSFAEAARRLGSEPDDVVFLGACGVLERRGEGVSEASLERFVVDVTDALEKGEALAAGVERAVIALRSEWDRALVARGPEQPRRVFGAVPLGEHPDGTLVYAVEGALDRIVSRNLHVLGGRRVRQLIVDRSLMERWGAQPDLLEAVAPEVIALVSTDVARRRSIVPVEVRAEVLVLASATTLSTIELEELRHELGRDLDFVLVPEAALAAALDRYYAGRKKIGQILLEMGFVTPEEVEAALEEQRRAPGAKRLGQLLVDQKACDGEQVAKALAHQSGLRYALLERFEVPPEVIELVPRELAVRQRIVPLKLGKRALIVAVESPLDFIALDDLRFQLGHEVQCVIASEDGITEALGRYYGAVAFDELECKMAELTGSIEVKREDLESLGAVDSHDEPSYDEPEPVSRRITLEPTDAPVDYRMVPATKAPVAYASFDEVQSRLGVDEEELKKLVSQGELRGFRDGLSMKFKAEDVANLEAGRDTEATIMETDSGRHVALNESSDELILEDSTTETIVHAAGKAAPSDLGGIVFDRSEEQYTVSPHDTDPFASTLAVPRVSEDMGLVEPGEADAFELVEESGEDDGTGAMDVSALRKDAREAPEGHRRGGGFGAADERMGSMDMMDMELDTLAVPSTATRAPAPAPAKPMAPPAVAAPSSTPMPIGAVSPMYARRAASMPAPMEMPVSRAKSGGGLGMLGAVAGAAFGVAAGAASLAASGVEELAKKRQAAPENKPAAPPKEDDEPETFERKATVRYYSQMYARRNYPLLVVVSKRSIQKIVKQHVAQVEGKKSFKIRRGNPFVTVRPILPGCLCVPQEITMNVKPKVAEAKFWVTPTAEGVLDEARVEVLYEGKVVSTIEVPTRVTTQALAKLTGSAAFLTTTAGPFFEAFGVSVKKESASFLADVLAHLAGGSYRYGLAGVLAFFALVFFLKRRPKAGPETEGFFDWGVEDEVEGDPLVKAVKAKLVVVGPEGRDVVDLIHASTLVGSAQTAHVRVKGARSLAEVACELRYDDTFHVRARSGGIKVNGEELREGEERKLGRDAVLDLDSGRVTLWLLDLRQDPAVDDRRDAILEALVRARPSFEKELRALWKRTAGEPLRGALLEAIRDAFADPHGWLRVRESLKIG